MKYILLLLTFIATRNISNCQRPSDNSSYYILGLVQTQVSSTPGLVNGTVFFIRKNDKLFLITARHVLSGCKDTGTKYPIIRHEMTVMIRDPKVYMEQVNINTKIIEDTTRCNDTTADFICMEIPNKYNDKNIYSLENNILPRLNNTDTLEIWGFPGENNTHHPSGFGYMPASHLTISKNEYTLFGDTINYYFKIKSKIADSLYGGYSGSPVFLKDKNSNSWRIIGLFVATELDKEDKEHIYLVVPKIEYALSKMQ